MDCFVDANTVRLQHTDGCDYSLLLGPENGCTGVCRTGISVYYRPEYLPAQAHPYQEGFFVLEGTGSALVGEQEFPLRPGLSFLAPAGTPHAVRCADPASPVRVLWFHA